MAVAEVLGRLCAGTMQFDQGARGGVAVLQGVEVAGYLAGLERGPMLLAMAKFMGDASALRGLLVDQEAWLLSLSGSERWGSPILVPRLAALSLSEVVDDKCERCHGAKFVRAKVCPACDGSGFRRVSGRAVAGVLSVPETTYRRVWKGRYADAVARLRGFESDINRALARSAWQGVLESV